MSKKIKAFRMRNSECGQWLYVGNVKDLLMTIEEDLIDLNYFNPPHDIQIDIEVVEMTEEEIEALPEFEGC